MHGRKEANCLGLFLIKLGNIVILNDKKNGTKKKTFHWEPVHQQAFDTFKQFIAQNIIFAYPYFGLPLIAYTGADGCKWLSIGSHDHSK